MSSFAPGAFQKYNRGSRGEMDTRSQIADERDRRRGRGKYDTRTEAQKKADNRRNLLTVATLVVPIGGAFRAGKIVHYGIMKQARPLVFTSRGTQQVRFYDLASKRFISKTAYHRRQGITTVPSYVKSGYRSGISKIQATFPRTSQALSRAEQGLSLYQRGPIGFAKQRLLNRFIPRPVQWGLGAIGTYVTIKDTVGDLFTEEDTGSYRRYRTPRVFNKAVPLARSNETRKVRWVYNESSKKSQPRCPSGFRYDSRSNSCVRIRR